MAQPPRKAIVIGGGIAGPVTAVLLKRAGLDVELFEAWPHASGIGGGLQIAPNGMHVLAELGIADELIRNGSIANAIDFYSQNGTMLGSINQDMQRRFGQPAVNMSRAMLNETIISLAWNENVALAFEKRLVRIEDRPDQPIVAHFADGTSAEGDFLIGADGVHSAVRNHVLPDGPTPFDTGLIGFGGFVPRAVVAKALDGQHMAMTFGRSGYFGYGFSGPDDAMWWSTQPIRGTDAAGFRAMDQDTLLSHLKDFHAGWHDPIPQILEAARYSIVTSTLDVATLPMWSRKRTILIGDAAHACSPHAGQGASLALEDAMRLSRLLGRGTELGTAFADFENERRSRVEHIVAVARRNGNQKDEFGPAGAWLRDQMVRIMLPMTAHARNRMLRYDPRAA